ncbi:MAG: electron transporter RnfC, partial [Bacilli bacterium]
MIFSKIKGVHISEHKGHKELSSLTPYGEYLNPEYVYIPLVEQDTVCEPLVIVGEKVKLGQLIAMKKGRFSSPIHASVSGEVIAIDSKMWHVSGKMVPTIQIKNDFQETKVESIQENNVSELTSEEIIEKIKDCGIVGQGGSGFPAYVKYMGNCPIDTVIINAVECEPYISDNYTIMKNQMVELISGIKYIMKAVDAHKAVIAIKKNKIELIQKMQPYFDAEPEISMFLTKDEYPAGWEKYLVQRITKRTYTSLPSEVG